jgi:PAS domain-containing protein
MSHEGMTKEQLILELEKCHMEIERLKRGESACNRKSNYCKSEGRFQIALQHPPVIVAHVDKDLRYTWLYNPNAAFTVEESLGKRDDEIDLNQGTLELMNLKKQVLNSGIGARKEIDFPIDSEVFTYDITAEPLRNETGQVIGVTTASTDITKRKQDEEKLRVANEQLKAYVEKNVNLMFELRRFRHNVLNILHGLSGYIEAEDWKGLTKYFNELGNQVELLKDTSTFSIEKIRNLAVRGLLTVKLNTARLLGINMQIQVEKDINFGEELIKDTDLCELLGIYLDNAIEASAEALIKKVSVSFIETNQYISVLIENSFNEKPDFNQIRLGKSTKGDGRGVGLKLSESILKRYPAILHNTMIQHQLFLQEIHISKQVGMENHG